MNELERAGIGAATGSALLLAAAFFFQYVMGLAPCELCIWQRWPHAIAILLGILMLVSPGRWIAALGALVMFAGAGIALYHTGIESGWWPGPTTCTAPAAGDLAPEDLLNKILSEPVVLCDEVAWSLFGISMAAWNGIASLVLAMIWLRGYASSSASQ
jgi:disulfide bond formation protein DsbB